jgi:peptide/nickel transport system substrate-binding protein
LSKYIRWQALLTILGIALIAAVLFTVAPRQAPTVTHSFSDATTVVQVRGGTYVEGVAGYPHLINPLFSHENDVDRDLCALIFEGLTQVDERNEIVPLLAERWQVSEDGLTYTFALRDSVRWQDGEPFTADDVVFTVGLLQREDLPRYSPVSELWRSVDVTKVDTYTVQFSLLEPYAPFLDYTTIGLLPEHVLGEVPVAEIDQHSFNYAPVGTGLFMVEAEESTPERIVLSANPYHRLWGETMLDRIEFKFYPSYEHIFAAYEEGAVMGVSRILAEDMERARSNPDLQLLSARLSGMSLILMNLRNSEKLFFQDQLVRQALLYALDRQRLIDDVLGGQGLILHSPIMPQSWAYDPNVKQYPHDLRQAVMLLEEAGWVLPGTRQAEPEGLSPEDAQVRVKMDQRLEFTLLTNDVPDRVALAHAIAEQWAEVGVRAHVQAVNISDLTLEYLSPRAFDAALVQWQMPLDPDPYPLWHSTQIEGAGQNYCGFEERDADEAIEVARLMIDHGRRAELYSQFQAIFVEHVPAILLYQPIYTYGLDRQVRNPQVAPMPDPSGRFRDISKWAVMEKEVALNDLNDQVGDKLDKRSNP